MNTNFPDRSNREGIEEYHKCATCWRGIDRKYTHCYGCMKRKELKGGEKYMTNEFFDTNESYEIPSDSKYINRFDFGKSVFRILGSFKEKTAIQGIVYWTEEYEKPKPNRIPLNMPLPKYKPRVGQYGPDKPKFFWSFPVYDFSDKSIKVMELTQKGLLRNLKEYVENPKWGDPRAYDIIINKIKTGEKTEYSLAVNPKEPLDEGIIAMYKAMSINMQALFEGGDPFEQKVDPDSIPKNLGTQEEGSGPLPFD